MAFYYTAYPGFGTTDVVLAKSEKSLWACGRLRKLYANVKNYFRAPDASPGVCSHLGNNPPICVGAWRNPCGRLGAIRVIEKFEWFSEI